MNILKDLNPSQREAVTTTEGPVLVLAGAGSGKTRVIVHRIAYLIKEKSVSPFHILAVTFTNKAAKEMKERVDRLLGTRVSHDVWVSTFHSMGARILRKDGERIGIPRNFVIYDEQDQMSLVKECLKDLNITTKDFSPGSMLYAISGAKDKLLSPESYAEQARDYFENTAAKIYKKYQEKLHQNKALDFDDLLFYTAGLFEKDRKVLDYYQERFQYILVDEYQDTNHVQYVITRYLAGKHLNLCVVGDEDQSIYRWRGANIRNILDFPKEYAPHVKILSLPQNYRSTQNILDTANKVIRHNEMRLGKELFTEKREGQPVRIFRSLDERDEARFVAQEIKFLSRTDEKKFKDAAILYRTHAQSRALEEQLLQQNIPYRIVGGLRFYERKEIKDLMSYLRLVVNPDDNVSFARAVKVQRGIGSVSLSKLQELAEARGRSCLLALEQDEVLSEFKPKARESFKHMSLLMQRLRDAKDKKGVTAFVKQVLRDSGYMEELEQEKTPQARARLENIQEFFTVTRAFERESSEKTLSAFLEHVSLITDLDRTNDNENSVQLMTFHNAKGLEFPVVFMVGMEEGIFPHRLSLESQEELEEERRICYVGITRAKEHLYMTYCLRREIYGSSSYNAVSRFIDELGAEPDVPEETRNKSRLKAPFLALEA